MSASTTRPTTVTEQPVPPVKTAEDAGKLETKGEISAQGKADVKSKGKDQAKKKDDAATSHLLTRPYAQEWVDPDKYHAEFFVGQAWTTLNNGKKVTTDHKGLSLGVDLRIKFPFGKNNAFYGSAGLRYQHNKQSFDLNPGESHLNMHTIGLTGGIAWRAVPEWLSLGAEVFLGPNIMRSQCNTDEEGFCDGESGTVFNLNAQANPVKTTGVHTGAALRVGVWRDIVNFRLGGGKTWGGGVDIETATQGTYSQPFSPGEFNVQVGINFAPLFSKKTWHKSTYQSKKSQTETKVPEKSDAEEKKAVAPKPAATMPEGPKAATPAELATQFAGHKTNISSARDRVKAIYVTDLKDTRRAPASVFGGEAGKQAKMKELVEEAKTKGEFAQLEYAAAKTLLTRWEKTIGAMPEGDDKANAQKELTAAKAEFSVKKDGQDSAMELNHSTYKYAKMAVDYYNDYAKKTKSVDKTAFDMERPEGLVQKSSRTPSKDKSKPKKPTEKSEEKKPEAKPEKKSDKKDEKKGSSVPAIDIPH